MIGGAVRSLFPHVRELTEAIARMWGCLADFSFTRLTSVVTGAEVPFAVAAGAAIATVGPEGLDDNPELSCAGEGFSNLPDACPGALLWIGNGVLPDGSFYNLHAPKYDSSNAIIPAGLRYRVNLAKVELGVSSQEDQGAVCETNQKVGTNTV